MHQLTHRIMHRPRRSHAFIKSNEDNTVIRIRALCGVIVRQQPNCVRMNCWIVHTMQILAEGICSFWWCGTAVHSTNNHSLTCSTSVPSIASFAGAHKKSSAISTVAMDTGVWVTVINCVLTVYSIDTTSAITIVMIYLIIAWPTVLTCHTYAVINICKKSTERLIIADHKLQHS